MISNTIVVHQPADPKKKSALFSKTVLPDLIGRMSPGFSVKSLTSPALSPGSTLSLKAWVLMVL